MSYVQQCGCVAVCMLPTVVCSCEACCGCNEIASTVATHMCGVQLQQSWDLSRAVNSTTRSCATIFAMHQAHCTCTSYMTIGLRCLTDAVQIGLCWLHSRGLHRGHTYLSCAAVAIQHEFGPEGPNSWHQSQFTCTTHMTQGLGCLTDTVQVVEVKKTFVGALVRIQAEGRAEVSLAPDSSTWCFLECSRPGQPMGSILQQGMCKVGPL
jgi:hypothetical protein